MSHEEHSSGHVVVAGIAPNELVALMWQQVLQDEGIVVALKPGGMGHGYATNALNEHYVLVRDDQAELARAILSDLESEDESIS